MELRLARPAAARTNNLVLYIQGRLDDAPPEILQVIRKKVVYLGPDLLTGGQREGLCKLPLMTQKVVANHIRVELITVNERADPSVEPTLAPIEHRLDR